MRRFFFLTIAVYFGLMIWGATDAHYRDTISSSRLIEKTLVYQVLLAVLIGGALFIWFNRLFPGWRRNQHLIGMILIPLIFIILSFVFNRPVLFVYNNYGGGQQTIRLNGPVIEKYEVKGRTAGRRSYYLVVRSQENGVLYKLRMTPKAYDFLGDTIKYFDKEFKMGALGVVYRRDL